MQQNIPMKPTRRDREKRPFASGHTECAWETLVYPYDYITRYLYQHGNKLQASHLDR